jgi:hypothetical protein
VATPTGSTDVATKGYVDSEINTQEVVLSLDVSGLTNADIAIIIQSIVATATNKSFISVDSNGTQNESVLQDVIFDPASGAVNLTVTRGLKRYRVDTGVWVFDADLPTGL